MKTLSVNIPKTYYDIISEIAFEGKTTKSDVFRKVNGLLTEGFNFDFSTHDKPMLNHVQSISILQYSLLEFMKEQLIFHTGKNKQKASSYGCLYKTTKIQYDYYSKSVLDLLDEGFNQMSDNLAAELAERVETVAYLIDSGNNNDWSKINKIGNEVRKRNRRK